MDDTDRRTRESILEFAKQFPFFKRGAQRSIAPGAGASVVLLRSLC